MKCRTVSIEEIKKGNKRLCLSTLRYFGRCFECPCFDKCESKIYSKKEDKFKKLKEELKSKKEEIENIEAEIKKL